MFSKSGNGKSKSKTAKRVKKQKSTTRKIETVVEVKTVGDIPPIVEARKALGNGEIREAIVNGYKSMKADYIRFFNERGDFNESNRTFIIRSLKQFGLDIPERGYLDNSAIIDGMNTMSKPPEGYEGKFNALKKISLFYLNFYERARFARDMNFGDDEILERMIDAYNYMDIMKLYFPEINFRRESVNE